MSSTSFKWIQLLISISLASQGKLSKVYFYAKYENPLQTREGFPGDLLLKSAHMLNRNPEENLLKEIHFYRIPIPISVVAKGERTFSVNESTSNLDPSEWRLLSCRVFLKELVRFTGVDGGLVKLGLDFRRSLDLLEPTEGGSEELLHLFQEIQSSRRTLEELKISFNSNTSPSGLVTVFDLVTSMSNLSSLSLQYYPVDDETPLVPPKWQPSFNLKELDLNFSRTGLESRVGQWDWISSWVSTNLEKFSLSMPEGTVFSRSFLPSILDSSSANLKTVSLNGLFIVDSSIPSTTSSHPNPQIIPKLQTLSLSSINSSVVKALSQFQYPQVDLFILTSSSISLQSLSDIFTSISSELEDMIMMEVKIVGGDEQVGTRDQLAMPNLQKLYLERTDSQIIDILTASNMPNLESIQIMYPYGVSQSLDEKLPSSTLSLFIANAPSLQCMDLIGNSQGNLESKYEGQGIKKIEADFPHLTSLDLRISCPLLYQQIFQSKFPKLASLSIKSSEIDFDKTINFIRSISQTLETLTIDVKDSSINDKEEGSTNQDRHLSFPNLTSFVFCDPDRDPYSTLHFLKALSGMDRSELESLSADEQFSIFRDGLQSKAPNLESFGLGIKKWKKEVEAV